MVADIIDEQQNWWDVNKINSVFVPQLARKILQNPLLSLTQPNQQIWNLERNGHFTVKSPSKLIMDASATHQDKSPNVTRLQDLWQSIWKRKVSKKI